VAELQRQNYENLFPFNFVQNLCHLKLESYIRKINHSMYDKLGQWDPNTFSRIETQTQGAFGVTTLGYHHYWQVVGGRTYGQF